MNGSTHPDFTDYYEVLPSNKLATALWLESDRMRSLLAITDENLKNQKEAVKQERRLSFDNQPYTTAIVDVWPTLMFGNWQSSHSLIGSFEDLNAASVADVSKFFKTYYAPNNAALVIVGDIRIPEAKKLIETYFGDIPSQPATKAARSHGAGASRAHTKVYKDPLARVPGVIIGYPGPKRRSPDYYALYMLDAILTGGDSSRFRLDLVKGKESVHAVRVRSRLAVRRAHSDYRDPEPYAMFLLYKPNFTARADRGPGAGRDRQTAGRAGGSQGIRARQDVNPRRATSSNLQGSLSRAKALAQYEHRGWRIRR